MLSYHLYAFDRAQSFKSLSASRRRRRRRRVQLIKQRSTNLHRRDLSIKRANVNF